MLKHRCPWCGEVSYPSFLSSKIRDSYGEKGPARCNQCGKPVKRRIFFRASVLSCLLYVPLLIEIILLFSLETFKQKNIWDWLTFLIVLIGGFWITKTMPYIRIDKKRKELPYDRLFSAEIQWGQRAPFFHIPNREVLPICFIDEAGKPVSSDLCVILVRSEWQDHKSITQLQFVREDVEPSLPKPGSRFVLYLERSIIGRGIVL